MFPGGRISHVRGGWVVPHGAAPGSGPSSDPRGGGAPAPAAPTATGCEASSNSRNSPVTTKATCSPISTALSPIRSIARAASSIVIPHSRRSASSPISSARWKHSRLSSSTTSSRRTRSLRHLDVALLEGPLRLHDQAPGVGAHLQDQLDHPRVDRRVVAGQRDHLADVDALVPHPLDALQHVQQGRDQPQVGRHRRLRRQQRDQALVDLQVAAVDPVVVGDHHLRQLDVLVLDRFHRAAEGDVDQVEAAEARSPPASPVPPGTRRGLFPASSVSSPSQPKRPLT